MSGLNQKLANTALPAALPCITFLSGDSTKRLGIAHERVVLSGEQPREEAASQALGHKWCGICGSSQKRSAPVDHWQLYRSAAYLNGHGLHFFGNMERIFHKRANTTEATCLVVSDIPGGDVDIVTRDATTVLKKGFANWIYLELSAIEHMQKANAMYRPISTDYVIKHSTMLLAPNGHLLVSCKATQSPEVLEGLAKLGGWVLKDRHSPRVGLPELLILKKLHSGKSVTARIAPTSKRACVWRSGALGDLVMITPLLTRLKNDGYHVTVCTSRNSMDLLREHPAVDNILMHEREVIHNPELGPYWEYWEGQYDKYVNLSESIEGDLLRLEGRRNFYDPADKRTADCGSTNYFVHTLRKGGYEPTPGERIVPTLYFTDAEHRKAQRIVAETRKAAKAPPDAPLVMWLLKGSSYHKTYPMILPVVQFLLETNPTLVVALSGGPGEEHMAFSHESERVVSWVGRFSPRMAMLLPQYVDLVVGPETGLMNAAACYDTPKIVLLSHSSHKNLCEFWSNTITVEPDRKIAPCYGSDGCHQLHYSLGSCPLIEAYDADTDKSLVKAPACTLAVSPERLSACILNVLTKFKPAVKTANMI